MDNRRQGEVHNLRDHFKGYSAPVTVTQPPISPPPMFRYPLSQAEKSEYKDCFTLYDKDNRGQIDVGQLGTVVRSLGQRPTDAQVVQLSKKYMKKNTFSFDDLVRVMEDLHANPPAGQDEVKDAFRVFDRDGNGYVSAAELRHVMTNLGEKLTDAEVDEMLRAVDVDDGQISYDDVVRLMVQ